MPPHFPGGHAQIADKSGHNSSMVVFVGIRRSFGRHGAPVLTERTRVVAVRLDAPWRRATPFPGASRSAVVVVHRGFPHPDQRRRWSAQGPARRQVLNNTGILLVFIANIQGKTGAHPSVSPNCRQARIQRTSAWVERPGRTAPSVNLRQVPTMTHTLRAAERLPHGSNGCAPRHTLATLRSSPPGIRGGDDRASHVAGAAPRSPRRGVSQQPPGRR